MKIIFVISESYLRKPALLEELHRFFPDEYIIDAVFLTNFKSGKVKLFKHLKRYYYLLGKKQLFIQGLSSFFYALYNIIDKILLFKKSYSVEMVCKKRKINYYKIKNINDRPVLTKIKEREPEIIINLGNQIFKEELLSIPKFGCINKHCSLLPSYKGIYPVWWSLLYNEQECGVSIHLMDKEIDTGKIIVQEKISITPSDTFFSLYEKCYAISPEIIIKALRIIEKGEIEYVSNSLNSSYFGYPDKKESKLFFSTGKKIK